MGKLQSRMGEEMGLRVQWPRSKQLYLAAVRKFIGVHGRRRLLHVSAEELIRRFLQQRPAGRLRSDPLLRPLRQPAPSRDTGPLPAAAGGIAARRLKRPRRRATASGQSEVEREAFKVVERIAAPNSSEAPTRA